MCTSGTDEHGPQAARTALAYLAVSILCALFGAVYERFSHGVHSYYLIYAFAFPLLGGVLPYLLLAVLGTDGYPRRFARNLCHSGIATLTVGSIVRGILDIYGTTNGLSRYYWIVGLFAVMEGAVIGCVDVFVLKK